MREALARLGLACVLAALCGCAARAPHPDAFSFAVVGDAPYNAAEERAFEAMIERMNREPLAFVLHVGDFKGPGPCTDEIFQRRRAQLDRSEHALVYTPGDNEWTDCRGADMGRGDALEALARLRETFFASRRTLGRKPFVTDAQDLCAASEAPGCPCAMYPENRFWSRGGVRFVTLHVVGSNDNVGFGAASDEEARCRRAASLQWLERAARAAEHSETVAFVVAMQANPFERPLPTRRDLVDTPPAVYRDLLRRIEALPRRLRKPVLLIHGDSHTQRVDTPFRDPLGNAIPGITRLEAFGSPFVGWVKVDVDPDHPEVFRFEPKLQAVVAK